MIKAKYDILSYTKCAILLIIIFLQQEIKTYYSTLVFKIYQAASENGFAGTLRSIKFLTAKDFSDLNAKCIDGLNPRLFTYPTVHIFSEAVEV